MQKILWWEGVMLHIAGNSVLDIPLRYAPNWAEESADGWTAGNVHFLQNPVRSVLGGCGAATAYVLGMLRHPVSLNTQLGHDPFGRVIREWFAHAKVEVVGSSSEHTAVNVIPLGEDGSRRSLYYTGSKIDWQQSQDVVCDTFFASGYGQVDADDIDALAELFVHMKSLNVKVVFDPGPWFMMRSGQDAMQKAWQAVDVLIGTQDELNTWRYADDSLILAARLREFGPSCVVVKQGPDGATFCDQEGVVGHVETERIEQAYTVGAGDTFNAGLLHGLSNELTFAEAVKFGVDLATKAVRSGRGALGAVDS